MNQEIKREWEIWTLSIGDIQEVCNNNGIDFNKLNEEQIEDIAYYFKKGFLANCDFYTDVMEEAIKKVLEEKENER